MIRWTKSKNVNLKRPNDIDLTGNQHVFWRISQDPMDAYKVSKLFSRKKRLVYLNQLEGDINV